MLLLSSGCLFTLWREGAGSLELPLLFSCSRQVLLGFEGLHPVNPGNSWGGLDLHIPGAPAHPSHLEMHAWDHSIIEIAPEISGAHLVKWQVGFPHLLRNSLDILKACLGKWESPDFPRFLRYALEILGVHLCKRGKPGRCSQGRGAQSYAEISGVHRTSLGEQVTHCSAASMGGTMGNMCFVPWRRSAQHSDISFYL